ncbi:MAG: AraC family transcriptional regulator [Actinobacteria bacterium]|nr:AraC family transcriptional regulator [Actinomycetota bacterium]
MDALEALLDGPRARRAAVLRAHVDPPFGIRVADGAALCVVALLRGTAWARDDDGPALRVDPGGLVLARGPRPWTLADTPDRRPTTVIGPGNVSTDLDGDPLCHDLDLGVRAWGTRLDAGVAMVVGTYEAAGDVGAAALDVLPHLAVLPREDWDTGALDLLAAETARDAPGQDAVVDRLLDVVLVAGLRAWLTRPECAAPGWYRGRTDPVAARALRLLHDDPAAPWTLDSLARAAGVSRATLARRFTALVGRPPMAYLTGWRLALAADLLAEPGTTVAAVSRRVGYATPFAFSAAFKRERGVSPTSSRARPARTAAATRAAR